jgi:hypothetical protein
VPAEQQLLLQQQVLAALSDSKAQAASWPLQQQMQLRCRSVTEQQLMRQQWTAQMQVLRPASEGSCERILLTALQQQQLKIVLLL